MMKYVLGYVLAVCVLLSVLMVTFGFSVTLQGFLLIHVGCSLAGLLLWWSDERQWQRSMASNEDEAVTDISSVSTATYETETFV